MQEKRVHPRVPIDTGVACELRDGTRLAGVAKDISVGGMFVECPQPLPFGTELTIVGKLPGAPAELRLPGVVRWAKPGGLGVQFGLLGARETHAIARILRQP
jgi:hypothetical protein